MVSAAQKSELFASADSLQDAVSVFVRTLLRPADPAGEIVNRVKIAERLAQTNRLRQSWVDRRQARDAPVRKAKFATYC